jgi:hypothetical protein
MAAKSKHAAGNAATETAAGTGWRACADTPHMARIAAIFRPFIGRRPLP